MDFVRATGWPYFSQRTRVPRVDLCVQLAGRDRGACEHPVLGGRNRSRARRRQPARPDSALVAAGADCPSAWQLVLDKEPLDAAGAVLSGPNLRPGRNPGSDLHERHDRPSQRCGRDPRKHSGEYRPSQLLDALPRRRRAISTRRRFFTFSIFRSCSRRRRSALARSRSRSSAPQSFCETVERERVSHTVLVPTMINLLTQFPDLDEATI